jgi:hypothetical protein
LELWKSLPRLGVVERTHLLGQLDGLHDDALLLVVVADL